MPCKKKCIGQCVCSIKEYENKIGDRWANGVKHHPKSEQMMKYLKGIDFEIYDNTFDWGTGGDGDNGESLMYQLDAFFDAQDRGEIPPVSKKD